MVARGDLGSECPIEDLPIIQRTIVERCSYHGRKVIVATQMLESMIANPVPTRAEVTDIFNAVIEQVDCVMLSGETSVGRYPDKCVDVLHRVISRIEAAYKSERLRQRRSAEDEQAQDREVRHRAGQQHRRQQAPGLHRARCHGASARAQRPEMAADLRLHAEPARQPHADDCAPGASVCDRLRARRPGPEHPQCHQSFFDKNLIEKGDPLVILSDALYDEANVDGDTISCGKRDSLDRYSAFSVGRPVGFIDQETFRLRWRFADRPGHDGDPVAGVDQMSGGSVDDDLPGASGRRE